MRSLTKQQTAIFAFIKEHITAHGYAPSYREIMQAFGMRSVSSVHKHIKSLRVKGMLQKEEHLSWRSCIPIEHESKQKNINYIEIPFIGAMSAGKRMEVFANPIPLSLPTTLFTSVGSLYGFIAKDNSFSEYAIMQDDLFAVQPKNRLENGAEELIVALDQDQKVFIGHGIFTERGLLLDSSHSADEVLTVYGIVVALVRKYPNAMCD